MALPKNWRCNVASANLQSGRSVEAKLIEFSSTALSRKSLSGNTVVIRYALVLHEICFTGFYNPHNTVQWNGGLRFALTNPQSVENNEESLWTFITRL